MVLVLFFMVYKCASATLRQEEKEVNTKVKNDFKKRAIGFGVTLVLLIALGFLSGQLGVFDGMEGVLDMVSIGKDTLFKLLLAIVLVVCVSNLILLVLKLFQNKKGRISTLATVISSLVKYSSVLIGFCWGLSIIGVNVSTIFASVGIVALILGFGAESLVADMVTGVFILFENQYNVGDIIEVDGFRGVVQEIGIRTISVTDSGGNIKIINNADMKNVINRSNQRSVAVTDISVSYDTNLEELDKKLVSIFKNIKNRYPDVFIDRLECAGVETLTDSGVTLRFIADVTEENIFKGKRILNKELKLAFDKEQIVIPCAQVEVRTK